MIDIDRRDAIALTAGLGIGGIIAPAPAYAAGGKGYPGALDLTNPTDALIAGRKCSGTLEDGVQTFSWMDGTVFAVFEDGKRMEALYGVVGVFPSRAWRQEDGSFKVATCNNIMYTDLATGAVLESYDNPYTGETVEPIGHSSHLQTIVRPSKGGRSESAYIKLDTRWVVAMDNAIQISEFQMRKPNPIDPKKYKRESSGEWFYKKQSGQMIARLSELEDPNIPSVNAVSVSERFGPWYPWMLMGGHEGRNFSHMVIQKTFDISDVPRPILEHVEKHAPEYLDAPTDWTGLYVDPETLYTQQREPAA